MRTAALKPPTPHQTALSVLTENHQQINQLFKNFEKLAGGNAYGEKAQLIHAICTELVLHLMVTADIFYPAVRMAMEDDALINAAQHEHAGAQDLIRQLQRMSPREPLYDAVVSVLGQYIAHQFDGEEFILSAKVSERSIDLRNLGTEMLDRKKLLKAEMEEAYGAFPVAA